MKKLFQFMSKDEKIEELVKKLAATSKELADTKQRLSKMASMYSDSVDVFKSGHTGYRAVLLGQRQVQHFRATGIMLRKSEIADLYEATVRRP